MIRNPLILLVGAAGFEPATSCSQSKKQPSQGIDNANLFTFFVRRVRSFPHLYTRTRTYKPHLCPPIKHPTRLTESAQVEFSPPGIGYPTHQSFFDYKRRLLCTS